MSETMGGARLDEVRDHYRATGLVQRLKTALAALGPEDRPLAPERISAMDQFHTRGLEATLEIAKLAGIGADMTVLDIGAGLGGPARLLAARTGCRVTGIDLSESFVDAARYLTERTGQSARVSFRTGDACDLAFDAGSFDCVLLQHVAMNIADRAALYREIRRVIKPDGRFATFDVVLRSGEPYYPLPWARASGTSFLLTEDETLRSVEIAGFRARVWQDDTAPAIAWFDALRAAGPPSPPNLGLVMGPDFAALAANLGRSLAQGRLGILTAVFAAMPTAPAIRMENFG